MILLVYIYVRTYTYICTYILLAVCHREVFRSPDRQVRMAVVSTWSDVIVTKNLANYR